MKTINAATLLLLCLNLAPVFCEPLADAYEKRWAAMDPTSLIRLIATPEKFDGKVVGVEGYLSTEYEDSRLYLTKEDADFVCGANAIGVAFAPTPELRPQNRKHSLTPFNHQRVSLCGRFNAQRKELADVVRVVLEQRYYDGTKNLQLTGMK